MAGTKILYAQGSQGNFLYEKILDRPGIEPVTLSMVMLNTRAFTASAIWAHGGIRVAVLEGIPGGVPEEPSGGLLEAIPKNSYWNLKTVPGESLEIISGESLGLIPGRISEGSPRRDLGDFFKIIPEVIP